MMKKTMKYLAVMAAFMAFAILPACNKDSQISSVEPTLLQSVRPAGTVATVSAYVEYLGKYDMTVEWSPSEDLASAQSLAMVGDSSVYSATLTGLSKLTTYYYRVTLSNAFMSRSTQVERFTTLDNDVPTVTTAAVTNVGSYSATGGGNVTGDGGNTVTERGVCWSTSHNPTVSGSHASIGSGTGNFTVQMTNLTPNTKYYMRAYAINGLGTGYGNEVSFTTQEVPTYTISVSASPTIGGTATGGGTYQQGQSCTVHATANSGYFFSNWTESDIVVSTNANYTFTVNGSRNLVANYQQQTTDQTFTVNGVSFTMKRVEGGTFWMGAQSTDPSGQNYDSEAFDGESPVHSVTLSTFYMGETEVTQELWQAVMGSNPSYYSGTNLPVEQVSWNMIVNQFIPALNAATGQNFRLPTEAEWEYASRGGNQGHGYKYAGSNTIGNVAWYSANSNSQTHAVATKQPNELGLYDMSGNVYEWCSDWYGSYGSGSQTNPQGPSSGSYRVLRCGSWGSFARGCRVSNRYYGSPDYLDLNYGFRLALPQ